MKKLICVCLVLTALLGLSVAASAVGNETVTVATMGASAPGKDVVFTISVSESEPVLSCEIDFQFPEDAFSFVSFTWQKGPEIEDVNSETGAQCAQWSQPTAIDGLVGFLVLRVSEDVDSNVDYRVGCRFSVTTENSEVPQIYANVTEALVSVSCTHPVYTQTVAEEYLKTAGDCTTPAEYYVSCSVCGQKGEETFTATDVTAHDFTAKLEEEAYLKQPGTCAAPAEYYVSCSVCGKKGTETFTAGEVGEHDFTGKVETEEYLSDIKDCQNKREYFVSCTVCGEKGEEVFTSEKKFGFHIYDNDCDTECNVCGKPQQANHQTGEVWSSDQTGHWMECSVCLEKVDFAAHEPGPEATAEESQLCAVCGYVLAVSEEHQHEYSPEWAYDEKSHWHECSCGGKSDLEVHSWSVIETEDKTVLTAQCSVCGMTKEEPVTDLPDDTTATTPPTTAPTVPSQPQTDPGENDKGIDPAVIVLTILLVLSLAGNGVLAWMLFGKKKKPAIKKNNA